MKTITMTPALVLASLVLLSLLIAAPTPAFAQADPKAAAREYFNRGVDAYENERFGEAAEAFAEAYRLSPAFVVLYNIGQVNVALGKAVEAVDAYEQYLKEGASTIAPELRRKVEGEIQQQLARIGTVLVRTSPEQAEIRLDGRVIGKTPLAQPVRVTAGPHTIEAMLADHATKVREINVAGRTATTIEITLEAVGARVDASRPAAPSSVVVIPLPPQAATAGTSASAPSAGSAESMRQAALRASAGSEDSSISWQRVVGYAISIGGVAAMTVGGVMAYQGANQVSDANTRLAAAPNDAAYDVILPDRQAGESRTRKGWIIAGIGTGALLGGIIIISTAPSRTLPIRLMPSMTAQGGGLNVHYAW